MADCLTVSVESSFDDRGMALAGAVMAGAAEEGRVAKKIKSKADEVHESSFVNDLVAMGDQALTEVCATRECVMCVFVR